MGSLKRLDRGAIAPAPRVLVLQREEAALARIGEALGGGGLALTSTTDGEAAARWSRSGGYDLVILDLEAPGLGGLAGCRALRAASDVPIVIVTARDAPDDRVQGLEAGADDYVGASFSRAELGSRVRAILRRRRLDLRVARAVRRIGDVEIDFARHRVVVAGRPVHLTPSEFRLLAILARDPGRPLSGEEILRRLWETEHVGSDGACRTHISNLRKKIDPDPVRPHRIVTVPRVGYLLRREAAAAGP